MSKRAIYLVPLSVFLVMAVYFAIGLTKDPKIIPSALIDKLIPEFSLPPIDNGTPQGYGKGFSSADPRGRVGIDWGVYGIPETFVVDGTGKIYFKYVGPLNGDILENQILPVIEKLKR